MGNSKSSDSELNLGINGLGRIGKLTLWQHIARKYFGEIVINVGRNVTSPNEKYYRLLARQPLDECLKRAAIRNLRMFARGLSLNCDEQRDFVKRLPPVPESLINLFANSDRLGGFNTDVDEDTAWKHDDCVLAD